MVDRSKTNKTGRSRSSSEAQEAAGSDALARSIVRHAEAIEKLAQAMIFSRSSRGDADLEYLNGETDLLADSNLETTNANLLVHAKIEPLTRDEIRAELAAMFGKNSINESDTIFDYIMGGPGAVAGFWEPLVERPAFRRRRLRLSPNDLRFVSTVGDMISVINWGLKNAK